MLYNPLKQAEIKIRETYHEYIVDLNDSQKENLIEGTDYIWYLKQDEVEHEKNTIQSIKYKMSGHMIIRFSGSIPTDQTIQWLDKKIKRIVDKTNEPPVY